MLYNVPQCDDLLDLLARELLRRADDDPLALADIRVLLPNRRAIRGLQTAFLRASEGRALILPRLQSLGDLNGDNEGLAGGLEGGLEGGLAGGLEGLDAFDGVGAANLERLPALDPLPRAFTLSRLVAAAGAQLADRPGSPDLTLSPDQCFRMAMSLGALLDQAELEGIDLATIPQLVTRQELAGHWEASLAFLEILFKVWPTIERAMNKDNAARQMRQALEAASARWRVDPPSERIIAAGSTGSIPATRNLLATIATLPNGNGEVILPGLDRVMTPEDWEAVSESPSHPQANLFALVQACETQPDAVTLWPGSTPNPTDRERLTTLSLLPAARATAWTQTGVPGGQTAAVNRLANLDRLANLYRLDCAGSDEEARSVALLMRESLEQPTRRCALITPDRTLARRVIQELRRWDIDVDDSAGRPLKNSAHGLFARQVLTALVAGFEPVSLMAALKHPLALVDPEQDRPRYKGRLRALEGELLRGEAPARGIPALAAQTQRVAGRSRQDPRYPLSAESADFLADLCRQLVTFDLAADPSRTAPFDAWCTAHLGAIQALVSADAFWRGSDAESLSTVFDDLARAAAAEPDSFQAITAEHYRDIFEAALGPQVSRRQTTSHPRLAIQGTIEARLERADRVILAGLNEGVWPSDSDPGPWLSNGMRQSLGLPTTARKLSLQAHDFAQALGADEVWLLRTAKEAGSQTRPSRWLQRLDAVMEGAGLTYADPPFDPCRLAPSLEPARESTPIRFQRPVGQAPVKLRPARLPVTDIETWIKDPYGIYAKRILKLSALAPLAEQPSIRERGTIVHGALEEFFRAYPDALPNAPLQELEQMAAPLFEELVDRAPAAHAFWWPRFRRAARWIVEREKESSAKSVTRLVEQNGTCSLGNFELYGFADRLDRWPDGSVDVLDYKVGTAPKPKHVAEVWTPQLPLEGILIEQGGFDSLPNNAVGTLRYWKVGGSGRQTVVETVIAPAATEKAIAKTREKLAEMIDHYAQEAASYPAVPDTSNALRPAYSDYKLLARWDAWLDEDGETSEGADT